MENQRKIVKKPPHYDKISLQKRQELVDMVLRQTCSITKASKTLGIKLSTAKLIVKRYKEEGTFFEKRSQRAIRMTESLPWFPQLGSSIAFQSKATAQIYPHHQQYFGMPINQLITDINSPFVLQMGCPGPLSWMCFPNFKD